MAFRSLKYQILAAVGLSVAAGIFTLAQHMMESQERAILAQNEETVHRLTESVIGGLQSVMLAGYAHIAQDYAMRLKSVPDVIDFRILRTDGTEAFRDNATIGNVNQRRGEEQFVPRSAEENAQVLSKDHSALRELLALDGNKLVSYPDHDAQGGPARTYLDGIPNLNLCFKCHGSNHKLRGIIKLTMSLQPVENEIRKTRNETMLGAGIAIVAVLLLTGWMVGSSVLRPIERVTKAMGRAAGGDLEQQVPVVADDEIGQMARSFNTMTAELKRSYAGLKIEQDKLTTIILSAGEGIVVTDRDGEVVLANPAAERLLGKPLEAIVRGGFLDLLDDRDAMQARLERGTVSDPEPLPYNDRLLAVSAATISTAEGEPIGSAALIRDVTVQKRLEEELRRQSRTDVLTTLYNRRHLDETLAAEFDRSRRYGTPLSVLMVDVDHFKRFNDAHGHEMGDRVLREVAVTLKGALRNHDVACRYGGEEFTAILPNTGLQGALKVAERLREDVEELSIDGLKVTISVGLATYPDVPAGSPEELVRLADAALYQAKTAGRNRVACAQPVAPPAG